LLYAIFCVVIIFGAIELDEEVSAAKYLPIIELAIYGQEAAIRTAIHATPKRLA
jgi:hypothetical protein